MPSPDDDFADVAGPAFQSLAAAVSTAGPENEREVDTALLQRGDVLRVFPGAHFPADGIVLCGKTAADESMITGESMPVSKSPGDGVIGGTVNRSGMVLVSQGGVVQFHAFKGGEAYRGRAGGRAPIQASQTGERGVCSGYRSSRPLRG